MNFDSGSILFPESSNIIKDVKRRLGVKGKVFIVANH